MRGNEGRSQRPDIEGTWATGLNSLSEMIMYTLIDWGSVEGVLVFLLWSNFPPQDEVPAFFYKEPDK